MRVEACGCGFKHWVALSCSLPPPRSETFCETPSRPPRSSCKRCAKRSVRNCAQFIVVCEIEQLDWGPQPDCVWWHTDTLEIKVRPDVLATIRHHMGSVGLHQIALVAELEVRSLVTSPCVCVCVFSSQPGVYVCVCPQPSNRRRSFKTRCTTRYQSVCTHPRRPGVVSANPFTWTFKVAFP